MNMPSTAKRLPPTVTTPLTRPPAGVRVLDSSEPTVHNVVLQRTPSDTEEHVKFEVSGMRSTSGKFTHILPGQEDVEGIGSLLGTEFNSKKTDNHGMKVEANGNHLSLQVLLSYLYPFVLLRSLLWWE